jgi:GTP-binding protein
VTRTGDNEFRVSGRDVERVVALNDVTSTDAMSYIGHRLERLGVNRLLARAGAADGDVVWIGDFSFEYRV